MTSALFGHRRGAFTGAIADVAGKVQEAEGGTLLLDEVGELTAEAQVRLLRFLNDQTYERLGEARERRADVRLIAATNRPLEGEVRTGRFRKRSRRTRRTGGRIQSDRRRNLAEFRLYGCWRGRAGQEHAGSNARGPA